MVSYRRLFDLAGRWFAGGESLERAVTKVRLPATPAMAWRVLLTYEEVKHRPPPLLRWLLPQPLGTSGDKTQVGADLPCQYQGGELTKRILIADAPHHLEFDVVGQHLGIEHCLTALGGSYHIDAVGQQSEIELTTRYLARLQPRWFWRPVEQCLAHAFHRHILKGMAASLKRPLEFTEGVRGCPTSPSASHR